VSWRQSVDEVSAGTLPGHVAIVMDGNGRWAKARGLPRAMGHRRGEEAAERVVRFAGEQELTRYLTLFAFSTENWGRPPQEVTFLMGLLESFLRAKLEELHEAQVRLRVLGQLDRLPQGLREAVERALERTAHNAGMNLTVAISFGGHWDLVEGARNAARMAGQGDHEPHALDEAAFRACLPSSVLPDVDLMIRTGGEQRLSNFLLWQLAYAELWFTEVLWPDFTEDEFLRAIIAFQERERCFGREVR